MKTGSMIAMVVLIIVSLAHLLRFIYGISLVVGDVKIPQSVSVLAFLFTAFIAFLMWKESRFTAQQDIE